MNISEMLGTIDNRYEKLCEQILDNRPLSAHDIEDLKFSNRQLHQDLYFQDYLRLRTIASIEVYHEFLRETLLNLAQIDIGEIDYTPS